MSEEMRTHAFRRAFWNLNQFGLKLARRFKEETRFNDSDFSLDSVATSLSKKRIAFVFKGPFRLAHSEFLREFLVGCRTFSNLVDVYLVLLDYPVELVKAVDLDHIKIFSLAGHKDTYSKLKSYAQLIQSLNPDHVSWVACVQNISLYMGVRYAKVQSYWSMKYHSIIMDSLDKYAGLGFGGGCFQYDDVNWFRGRAFPDMSLPKLNTTQIADLRKSINVSSSDILLGCFVRAEKLNNIDYWRLIERVLASDSRLHFVIASQSLPSVADLSGLEFFKQQFHSLGWVDKSNGVNALIFI